VASVLPFHRAVVEAPDFVAEDGFKVHTRWIETDFAQPLAAAVRAEPVRDAALLRTAVEIDGRRVTLGLPPALLRGIGDGPAAPSSSSQTEEAADPAAVAAPITGTLQAWTVDEGALVAQGDPIAVMEAMKMEVQVVAHRAGRLARLAAGAAPVVAGATIARIG